jgi:hypothetical protein
VGEVALRAVRVASLEVQQRGHEREQAVPADQPGAGGVEHVADKLVVATQGERDRVAVQQGRRAHRVPGVGRVRQRTGRLTAVGVPVGRDAAQVRCPVAVQPDEVGEQVRTQHGVHVVAVLCGVDPDDQRGLFGDGVEQRGRVRPAGQSSREVRGDLLADADRAQELGHVGGQSREHLVDQVRRDRAVVRGEVGEEPVGVTASGQRQRRQAQRGSPALGLLEEPLELVGVQLDPVGVEQRPHLGGGELQVLGADLGELVREPQPGYRQVRVVPRREDQAQVRGLVLQQGRQPLQWLRSGDLVEVVEDQHDRPRQLVEGVDHLGEEARVPARVRRHREPPQRVVSGHRGRGGQRVEQCRPEPAVVVVVGVERYPRRFPGGPLARPLGQQQRLSRPGRRADQGDHRLAGPVQHGQQLRPWHQPR